MSKLLPIISILILILLLAGGYFLWWPQYQEFKDLKFQLEKKTERISQEEKYFTELEALTNQLKEYQTELSKIESALPSDIDSAVINFFNFIQKQTSENGLILKEINWEKTAAPKISFAVSALGSYPALKNFLTSIYKNIRMIEIESISFSEPGKEAFFTFNLKLTTQVFSK